MKPIVGVHKFSSCDGCQLAFLNLGDNLLSLADQVDIIHFPEAGPVNADAAVDISFVEGSLSTPDDLERIKQIRANSRHVVTIGACATAGGLQALRNVAEQNDWIQSIYASPEYIRTLDKVIPIHAQIKVDTELRGCPVNSGQVIAVLRALLLGVTPLIDQDKVCMECKRRHTVCVMVTRGLPCMGPVTQTGCGAICPGIGRDCYGCYGSAEATNTPALARRFHAQQLNEDQIDHRFVSFNSTDPVFRSAGKQGSARND